MNSKIRIVFHEKFSSTILSYWDTTVTSLDGRIPFSSVFGLSEALVIDTTFLCIQKAAEKHLYLLLQETDMTRRG